MIADQINPIYCNMLDLSLDNPSQYGYERFEQEAFESLIQPGMVVVDVGANVGFLTIVAERLVGERGTVYVFEPDRDNYKLFRENVKLKGARRIVAWNSAVGNPENGQGNINLFVSDINDGGDHRVYQPHSVAQSRASAFEQKFELRRDEPRSKTQDQRESYTVPIVSLDWYFLQAPSKLPHVIKIDVQGFEYEVLKGMKGIIEKSKDLKLFIEFDPKLLNDAGADPYQFLADLHKDFHVYDLNAHHDAQLHKDLLDSNWTSRLADKGLTEGGFSGYISELMHPSWGRFSNLICERKV